MPTQHTLYRNDYLRVVEETGGYLGPIIWIGDDLEVMEVSLDASQVEAIIPILQEWLQKQRMKSTRD